MRSKLKRTFNFIFSHSIAKQKPLAAFFRLLKWQLQSSLTQSLIAKPFIGKVKFYAKKGLTGITGNIYTGLHEFNDMGFLLHFLRKEDTFFDIGANVGSYTLLASGYIGTKSVTFEPVPNTFEILSANVTLNQLANKVILHNKAIGSNKGYIKFTSNLDTVNHVLANEENQDNAVEVELATLDEFSYMNPSLIKIDVEGFETEVIKGGEKMLAQQTLKAIIIELNGSGGRYGYDEEHIHNTLISFGFSAHAYDPLSRTFTSQNSFGSHNTIYIRDIEFVKNRCVTAEKVKVLGVNF